MPMVNRFVGYLLTDGFHRMHYTAWGDAEAPPVVCVHGLTRNGRDFDRLAEALSRDFHVICPDLPGRGRSDWLRDPMLYQPASYVAALSHLLAVIDRPVHWVGTSLGGICGMILASLPGSPIDKLVLNDIGARIPEAALARIRDYIGTAPSFAGLPELEAYLRQVHAPFGVPDDAAWAAMAAHSWRALPDGRIAPHYDPAIAQVMQAGPVAEVNLEPVWAAVTAPTLLIRGSESDLLLPETFERMVEQGAEGVTIQGVGHAPALMDKASIARIGAFLKRSDARGTGSEIKNASHA